ncbi:MAG: YerC/YecD family TrpR-related protein [Legionellales bacterium]
MKTHDLTKHSALPDLMQAISSLKNAAEANDFFTDLCTPAELESMADRWQVVPFLRQGIPYRTIHEKTGVSVTTITRVARCLSFGTGGYNQIANRTEQT